MLDQWFSHAENQIHILVWKSFRKSKEQKTWHCECLLLFDQILEVNINCVVRKPGFYTDPSGTPGSLVLLLPERPGGFVRLTHWASVQNWSHWFQHFENLRSSGDRKKFVYSHFLSLKYFIEL
jgi:hypothetical protein